MDIFSKSIVVQSNELGREVELKIFGRYGFIILALPCLKDSFDEEVDFGFVQIVENYITNGLFRIVFVPTVENRIWKNDGIKWEERSTLQSKYNNFLLNEVLPNLFQIAGSPSPIITFGCGEAGFFASNIYFRHPDIFFGTISIDSFYDLRFLCGHTNWDENCYFNSPLDFLPNLQEEYWLIHLRSKKQVHLIATDQEDNNDIIEQTKRLSNILLSKEIKHYLEIVPPLDDDRIKNWQKIFCSIVDRYF